MPFLEALTAGAAANGISNWGSSIVQAMQKAAQRRSRLRRAISQLEDLRYSPASEKDPERYFNIKSKLDQDLRVVLSGEGMLNQSVDLTLNTISASPLSSHLFDCAICDVDPIYSLEFIDLVFFSVGGNTASASNPLSRIIWTAVLEVAKASNIHDQPDDVKAHVRRVEAAVQNLVQQYKSQISNGDLPSRIPPDVSGIDFDRGSLTFKTLASEIYLHLNIVDVHGYSGEILATELSSIFVDMPIYYLGGDSSPVASQLLSSRMLRSARHSFGYKELLSRIDRGVLLGNPGGGKSTLAKKLCLEIAEGASKGGLIIPIFIQLRTYVAEKLQNKSLTLLRYMLNQTASYLTDSEQKAAISSIQYLLTVGRCFIVFDGLDEVLSEANRLEIVKEIDNVSKRFPLSKIVTTSRIVGYKQIPVPGFTNFIVGDLEYDCSRELFRILSSVVFKIPEKEIVGLWSNFWKEARSKAADLISTPLLFTLITFMFHRKIDIPNTQADLYNSCSKLLFDRWDASRQIDPRLPESHRLWDLLMFLARYMYEDPTLGARIKKNDLIEKSAEFFIPDYLDNKMSRALHAAQKFTEHLTGRSWILCEIGEDVYEFTHRTFLEYFYARYMVSEHPAISDLLNVIDPWIVRNERVVAAQLSLQIITKESRSNSDQVAQRLNEILKNNKTENLAKFAADSLHYLAPSAEQTSQLTSSIVRISINASWVPPLQQLFRNAGPVAKPVKIVASGVLKNDLTVTQARSLGGLWDDAVTQKLGATGDRFDISAIIDALSSLINNKQYISPYVTKLAFDLTGTADPEALRRHGLRIWTRKRNSDRSDTRISDISLMLLEAVRAVEGRGNVDDMPYAWLTSNIKDVAFDQLNKWDFDHNNSYFISVVPDRIISDHARWIENVEIVELVAFASALHIEMVELIAPRHILKGASKIFFDAVDFLEELGSNKAPIFRVWEKGDVSFFSRGSRRERRRAALGDAGV